MTSIYFIMLGVVITTILSIMVMIKKRHHMIEPPFPSIKGKGDDLAVWPFSAMPVMTYSEVKFFRRLQQALPEYLIFGQVQLSRLIMPSGSQSDTNFWLNRINRMSVDYVIIAPDCRTTLVAIELDDWSHESPSRQQADAKKDKALSSAGIAIMRFHGKRMPSIAALRHEIIQVIALIYPNFV